MTFSDNQQKIVTHLFQNQTYTSQGVLVVDVEMSIQESTQSYSARRVPTATPSSRATRSNVSWRWTSCDKCRKATEGGTPKWQRYNFFLLPERRIGSFIYSGFRKCSDLVHVLHALLLLCLPINLHSDCNKLAKNLYCPDSMCSLCVRQTWHHCQNTRASWTWLTEYLCKCLRWMLACNRVKRSRASSSQTAAAKGNIKVTVMQRGTQGETSYLCLFAVHLPDRDCS